MLGDVLKGFGEFFIAFINQLMQILFAALSRWETWMLAVFFVVSLSYSTGWNEWFTGVKSAAGTFTPGGFLLGVSKIFFSLWWFWAFVILWPMFRELWLWIKQEKFKSSLQWVLLEIRIPREIIQSPRAMEQVLTAIWGLRNSAGDPKREPFIGIKETYFDGEVVRWFALEMISIGGEVHFYIRTYIKYRNLIEAAFYSYYPDIEIEEVEDFMNTAVPKTVGELFEQGRDLWAADMILNKPDAYPIRTYPSFEHPDEDKTVDPISTFVEVITKLKRDEFVGIQVLIAPAARSCWSADPKTTKLLEELKKPADKNKLAGAPDEKFSFTIRTPGETEVLKAVEMNLSKVAFETVVRFMYISPKDIFYDSYARRGLKGVFNQYSAIDLNSFEINYAIATRTQIYNYPYIFPVLRNKYRKQRMLHLYRTRDMLPDTWTGKWMHSYWFNSVFPFRRFLMNTEGVASLFHPPTAMVLTAPHVRRVESKKAGPPAGLAIFGGEESIERFVNPKQNE